MSIVSHELLRHNLFGKLLTGPPGVSPCELAVQEVGLLASSQLVGETCLLLLSEGKFSRLLLGVGGFDDLCHTHHLI